MRTARPALAPLFRSEHQLAILASLFLYGGRWTITELAAHAEAPLSTTSREVHRLVDAGLATLTARGQLRLVEANHDLPWATPLVELLDQSVGPIHHLRALLDEPHWASVEAAHIFGSWARRYHGEPGAQPNDIDLVLITADALAPTQLLRFQRELQHRTHLPVDAFSVTPDHWDDPRQNQEIADIQRGFTVDVHRLRSP